jgi:ribosomal protein L29
MSSHFSPSELRKMNIPDLRREVSGVRARVASMYLCIRLQKEKDTARYQRQKKELARLCTILREREDESKIPPQSKK